MYSVKDIMLGYVTTVNPDSYTIEGQLVKSVIALKTQRISKNKIILTPVNTYYPYYSIDTVVPISKMMKKKSTFISIKDVDFIVEAEKKNIGKQNLDLIVENTTEERQANIELKHIVNEIDIDKSKRLVA